MPSFGARSKQNLSSAHPDLQRLFNEVIKHIDCTVLEGHRDKEAQDKAFHEGKSQTKWPNSKHNSKPSMAVDVAPYPINWNDRERFYYFAGFVKATAVRMGINIRWGGDWDGDYDFRDQTFFDLPHFELVGTSAPTNTGTTSGDKLPDGPTKDDINISLEEIENKLFGGKTVK
jgi:peptidoglycan L-alanyl-D-glutamate endopeptidase CwlK